MVGLLVLVTLIGCSNSDQKVEADKRETESEDTDIQESDDNPEITVFLELEVNENQGEITINGETNLPDGMEAMITLSSLGGSYKAQDKVYVQDGTFESNTFTDKGSSLKEGKYIVRVTTPTASVQPEDVRVIIGDNGVNLVGKLIQKDSAFGNMLEYKESFTIGEENKAMTTKEPTEDDVYNYMKRKYDELTNYGADYIPEIHDSQVERLASQEFGISESRAGQIYIKKEMGR